MMPDPGSPRFPVPRAWLELWRGFAGHNAGLRITGDRTEEVRRRIRTRAFREERDQVLHRREAGLMVFGIPRSALERADDPVPAPWEGRERGSNRPGPVVAAGPEGMVEREQGQRCQRSSGNDF